MIVVVVVADSIEILDNNDCMKSGPGGGSFASFLTHVS